MADFFVSRPPAQKVRQSFPIVRSSAKHKLKHSVLCLSDRLTCCPTHHAGRTVPCTTPWGRQCPSCEKGHDPRWVAYFAAWDGAKKILFELTANAAEILAAEAERLGSIRGYLINVDRMGNRPNGQLLVTWRHANLTADQIPECFNVEECLWRTWRINEHIKKCAQATIPMKDIIEQGIADEDVFQHRLNGKAVTA
jgi:hypothetical protein